MNIDLNNEQKILWEKCKKEVLNDFTILDKKSFWEKYLGESSIEDIFVFYRKFKLLLRYEIVKYLKKNLTKSLSSLEMTGKTIRSIHLPSNFNPYIYKKVLQR